MRALFLLFAVALLAAGQTLSASKKSASGAHTRSGISGRAAASDVELEKAIRARFAASKIAPDKFEVHVQGGVAMLTGKADVIQHKGTATRLAKAAGAIRVVNKIEVSQAARDRASANLAKGRRRAQIKRGEERSERARKPL